MAKVEINEDAVRFIAKTRDLSAKAGEAKKKVIKLTEELRQAEEEMKSLLGLMNDAKNLALKHLFNDSRNG